MPQDYKKVVRDLRRRLRDREANAKRLERLFQDGFRAVAARQDSILSCITALSLISAELQHPEPRLELMREWVSRALDAQGQWRTR